MSTDREPVGADGSPEPSFHPDLRRAAFFIPRFSIGPRTARLIRGLRKRRPVPRPPALADVAIRDHFIEGPDGDPLRIRLFSPASAGAPRPAVLWMHGGGYVIGHPESDQAHSIALCRELSVIVAAVDYRLAPDHPFPAPLEDCYQALAWLHAQAEALNIDAARCVVAGASAGGGLAAATAQLAHDIGEIAIAFQLLLYPSLDDRSGLRTDIDERSLRIVSTATARFGWRSYLGREPGGGDMPPYAVPARRPDLSGLPPAWIGVGTADLFHDEGGAYAARLNAAGVPCTLDIVDGAFHAFDAVVPKAGVVAAFRRSYCDALRTALRPPAPVARPRHAGEPRRRAAADANHR
jgi:acetyl esterase/lipase